MGVSGKPYRTRLSEFSERLKYFKERGWLKNEEGTCVAPYGSKIVISFQKSQQRNLKEKEVIKNEEAIYLGFHSNTI